MVAGLYEEVYGRSREEDWERLERKEKKRKSHRNQKVMPHASTARNSALKHLIHTYRWNAKNRGYAFELDDDSFYRLTQGDCRYCGAPPTQVHKHNGNTEILYNGIDRIDNEIGYTHDNATTCCGTCNRMKSAMGKQEFLAHIQKIAEHQQI